MKKTHCRATDWLGHTQYGTRDERGLRLIVSSIVLQERAQANPSSCGHHRTARRLTRLATGTAASNETVLRLTFAMRTHAVFLSTSAASSRTTRCRDQGRGQSADGCAKCTRSADPPGVKDRLRTNGTYQLAVRLGRVVARVVAVQVARNCPQANWQGCSQSVDSSHDAS